MPMLQFLVHKIGIFVIRILPISWSKKIGEILFGLGYWLSPGKSKNARDNLTVVTGSSVTSAAREIFGHFGRYWVEFFLPLHKKEILRENSMVEGLHHVMTPCRQGRGVIILAAHLGNWELAAYMTAKLGLELSAVFFTHPNRRIDQVFMEQRRVEGLTVIPWRQDATRRCLEALKQGRILAIAGDIDFQGTGLEVELFGKKTKISRGPVVLARRTGSLIVPGGYVWDNHGKGTLFFDEGIDPRKYTEEELIQKVALALEKMIGRYPTQWFCFERIWD